jgi:hypothetical protein
MAQGHGRVEKATLNDPGDARKIVVEKENATIIES